MPDTDRLTAAPPLDLLPVVGPSMEPVIPSRAMVLVAPAAATPVPGDVVVFHSLEGGLYVHRLLHVFTVGGQDMFLEAGDNDDVATVVPSTRLAGVVAAVERDGGWAPVVTRGPRLPKWARICVEATAIAAVRLPTPKLRVVTSVVLPTLVVRRCRGRRLRIGVLLPALMRRSAQVLSRQHDAEVDDD